LTSLLFAFISGFCVFWFMWTWCWLNTVVSNHVNSDHVQSFSCLDFWTNRQANSGVYAVMWLSLISSFVDVILIRCFESFPFLQNFVIFVRKITWFRWTNRHWTSMSMYTKRTPIDICRFNVRSSTLKYLNISVKDRY
jgi:hypothetical protein